MAIQYSLTNPIDVTKWLEKLLKPHTSVRIFYHADVDGCVSAAFLTHFLSQLNSRVTTGKVFTSELGFEGATKILKSETPGLAVFLDLPAGTQFPKWHNQLPQTVSVFVYDHHNVGQIVNFPPRFVQYAVEDIESLSPACVFGHQLYESYFGAAPRWLTTVGLLGEGQQHRFQEYLTEWPLAKQVTNLIANGVLEKDERSEAALQYLVHYLSLGVTPPEPLSDPMAQQLISVAKEVDTLVASATNETLQQPDNLVVANLIEAEYEIANYIASNVSRQRPNSVVIVGQTLSTELVRAEVRTGKNRTDDLRPIIQEAKRKKILIGGGGHPRAVGARLYPENWDRFVDFIQRHIR